MTNPDNVGGLPEFVAVGEFVGYGRVTGEPHVRMSPGLRPGVRLFTEDQMRAYGELCRAAPAGGESFVTFENGHMKLDVNAFLKSPEGIAQLKSIRAASEHFAPAGSGEVEEVLKKCDSVLNDMRPISPCLTEQMEEYFAEIRALLRKLQQGADYVIVPREPTDEMVWAGRDAWTAAHHAMKAGESRYPMTETWRAMISASQGQEGGHG